MRRWRTFPSLLLPLISTSVLAADWNETIDDWDVRIVYENIGSDGYWFNQSWANGDNESYLNYTSSHSLHLSNLEGLTASYTFSGETICSFVS